MITSVFPILDKNFWQSCKLKYLRRNEILGSVGNGSYVMVFQTWTIENKIDDAGQDSKKVDKGEIAKSGKTGDVIWKFHFKKGLEMFYYSNYCSEPHIV